MGGDSSLHSLQTATAKFWTDAIRGDNRLARDIAARSAGLLDTAGWRR
jgi:hypothetical protein